MTQRDEAEISHFTGNETSHTKITFFPDLTRFKMDSLDDDTVAYGGGGGQCLGGFICIYIYIVGSVKGSSSCPFSNACSVLTKRVYDIAGCNGKRKDTSAVKVGGGGQILYESMYVLILPPPLPPTHTYTYKRTSYFI